MQNQNKHTIMYITKILNFSVISSSYTDSELVHNDYNDNDELIWLALIITIL